MWWHYTPAVICVVFAAFCFVSAYMDKNDLLVIPGVMFGALALVCVALGYLL